MSHDSKNSILLNLDKTITLSGFKKGFSELEVDLDILDALKIAKKNGYKIQIQISDKSKTLNRNLEKINFKTLPDLESWLRKRNIPFDEIKIIKEFEGLKNILVNEKSLSPLEFKLRTFSSTIFQNISVVSSFYNESQNVNRLWEQLIELDKYLNINQFIFVDNGSNDKTFDSLNLLKNLDNRVVVIQNQSPSSYSKGMSSSLMAIESEYTLLLHSDCQINIDTTIKSWLEEMYQTRKGKEYDLINGKKIMTTFRVNRDMRSNLTTTINNLLAYYFLKWPIFIDFNSQPKIINTNLIKDIYIEKGYLFDLIMINLIVKKMRKDNDIKILKPFPVIVRERLKGSSTWNGNFFKSLKIIKSYLKYLISEFFY